MAHGAGRWALGAGRWALGAGRWALGAAKSAQGATEKIKRENDVHLRQLAKKSTYVRTFFFFKVRFWAFLGKGSSKTREKN
jgi:hypothetical protein